MSGCAATPCLEGAGAQERAHKKDIAGDAFLLTYLEADLLDILERCGLEREVAVARFIALTVLHRSSRTTCSIAR